MRLNQTQACRRFSKPAKASAWVSGHFRGPGQDLRAVDMKGQHARSGGYHKVGFEGGQMPLQRQPA